MTKRWTKRCERDDKCVYANLDAGPSYIPNNINRCDGCVLNDYRNELGYGTYDDCSDPLAMFTLYEEENVIAALRKAENARNRR